MKLTVTKFLLLMVITGNIFTACSSNGEEVEVVENVEVEVTGDPVGTDSVQIEVEDADSAYVDGEYSVEGNYQSPAGPEMIGVDLTLEGDTVVALSVEVKSSHEVSQKYQTLFSEGVGSEIVGKKLSEIEDLGPVNGSSLSPKGFNDALAKIKEQATS